MKKMEVRLLEKSKDGMQISFLVRGISPAFANAVRRAVLEEVPALAIEKVEFRKNNSILYDEVIAHRLGLIPLKTNLKGYSLPEECKCKGEGCARCQAKFTLKSKAAGNVLASEMKPTDKDVVPVYGDMPITKLMKGQSLEFEAAAVLGKGKIHAKWCPGHIYYYNESKITVNNGDKLLKKFKEKYPSKIFDKDGKIDRNLINTPALVDACDGISKLIEIEKKDDSFIFVLESWGQLKPEIIVKEAVNQINSQFDEINGLMKK
ncbi:DNA-directed RNA polymerase subunit D [Candidatus Woesearchaeota archaeon]|nr:DNA-directed RNA polymerase subunit D [Candidatus Woesearchaeota archaeon]